jgi:hypothetical protein
MLAGVTWDKFKENKVAFITFNYDRSLEHFLYLSLRNSAPKIVNEAKIVSAIKEIPIIHPHGSLGDLYWQSKNGTMYKTIRMEKDRANQQEICEVYEASQRILIISEKDKNTEIFIKASSLFKDALRVIFLGFGYHEENLKRLGVGKIRGRDKDLYPLTSREDDIRIFRGSSMGIGESDLRAIRKKWNIYLPRKNNKENDMDFLADFGELDFE